MSLSNALTEFAQRVEFDLLPTYCKARNYSLSGFKPDSLAKVTLEDARDFLRALDGGLVERLDQARYRMPRSSATEVLFWEGWKSKIPRPITLWLEPVITFASVARLHFDYGWPKELLGTQPRTWAFDLSASLPCEGDHEYILGEVKKTERELEVLLKHMHQLCINSPAEEPSSNDPRRNPYKKWRRLRDSHASLFWAIGPAECTHLFAVERLAPDRISLREAPLDRLRYDGKLA